MERDTYPLQPQGTTPRIGVMVPVFYRGDRYVNFIWKNFRKQSYPNKKLFVCRCKHDNDSLPEFAHHYHQAKSGWCAKQEAYPQLLKFWEQKSTPVGGLGRKRNLMLQEMLKQEHGLDYIAAFDDDNVYASNYLTEMYSYFEQNDEVQLVNFHDFLGIQIIGAPVDLKSPGNERNGVLLQALEGSRAFLEALPNHEPPEKSQLQNKWYVHTFGGVLPSGFGFSFVYRASLCRRLGIQYGEDSERRSGEEDVLYTAVKEHFGDHRIVDLPISRSLELAAHMENGENIAGDWWEFRFPAKHWVTVPRPLSFVSTEILQFLKDYHPDEAIKTWAETAYLVKRRYPLDRTMTFVANQQETRKFAESWQQSSNWTPPAWETKSEWFVPPVGKPIPGGQDIPIEAQVPPQYNCDNSRPPFEDRTQRSLVVVPRSHLEYEYRAKRQLEFLQAQSVSDPSITIPTRHGVKILETWALGSPEIIEYEQRARQLDLRSVCQGTSCMLVWNSAMIHQGTRSLRIGTPIEDGAFVPLLLTPCVFPVSVADAWRAHLETEGYVVLHDVLGERMDDCLKCLLEDINNVNPSAKLRTLDEVEDAKHLGLPRRGLLYTLGFPHGEFAWAIRQDPNVLKVWKDLYETEEVIGSTDVPSVTCSESDSQIANSESHDEWLHWDQNALQEPVGRQKMFQSMVYLFPDETSKVGGSSWDRIAMVVCMVPVDYKRDIRSEKTLLALAITGEASNHWPQIVSANYGWNGMRREQIKYIEEKYPYLSQQEIETMYCDRVIPAQVIEEKRWERLYPKLDPNLTDDDLRQYIEKLKRCNVRGRVTNEELRRILSSSDYQTLRDNLDLEDLRRIVHPRVKNYVRFVA